MRTIRSRTRNMKIYDNNNNNNHATVFPVCVYTRITTKRSLNSHNKMMHRRRRHRRRDHPHFIQTTTHKHNKSFAKEVIPRGRGVGGDEQKKKTCRDTCPNFSIITVTNEDTI